MAVSITKSYTNNFLKTWLIAMLLFFNHTNGQLQSAADCNVSYRICDATQSYYFESNGPGLVDDSYTAFSGSTPYQTIYCIAGNIYPTPEWHPAWFIFTPQYSGEFGFLICPENQTVDWQWALFENPSCTDLSNTAHQLRCNGQPPLAAAEGCTGIGFKNGWGGGATGLGAYINVTAGNTYVLYTSVQQWWLTAPQRATLSFQGAVVASHPDLFNYAGCTASTENFVKDNTKVYPNPFTNELHIESESAFTQLELYDIKGKQILNQAFVNQISTGDLAKGMYLLRLTTEDGEVVVKKVVKE